ncbi:MAG: 3-isopropylmalate dehydratase [Desulfococcus sp. 4484_241]|nr:MAG: 3-isopropylmalate dehydratase [Desulfococcus sp. 4484_241]
MKQFEGNALFLDRSDINTDEIIPAKYLTEISKQALAPHLLEDLVLEGFNRDEDLKGKGVLVTRAWALEVNNINVVIAESFSRIFRQNMFNCGMLAAELPAETADRLFSTFAGKETYVKADLENSVLTFSAGDLTSEVSFSIGAFDRALLEAGGWLNYSDSRY